MHNEHGFQGCDAHQLALQAVLRLSAAATTLGDRLRETIADVGIQDMLCAPLLSCKVTDDSHAPVQVRMERHDTAVIHLGRKAHAAVDRQAT